MTDAEPTFQTSPEVGVRWHPYAEIFPWIKEGSPEEAAFVEDIRKNGVLEPIVLFEGQVLDGRNRYMAARKLGIKYPTIEYRGNDPIGYVIAKNLSRRHLSDDQRRMVAARLANVKQGRPEEKTSQNANITREQAATALSTDVPGVDRARSVIAKGAPELIAAVDTKQLSVAAASDIAKLSHDEQRKLIEAADPKVLRAVVKEKRAEIQAEKKQRRDTRERELAGNIAALPDKRYGVIYADPEWQFHVFSKETGQDRAAANHYPTSTTDQIAVRPIGDIAADDCALFLWSTAPMLKDALLVMEAWGFSYKSHLVWDKEKDGTGYWFRNRHELLLVGTRGRIPAPAMGTQRSSVQRSEPEEHSRKPDWAVRLIEQYFPNIPKIELNRRGSPRVGWDAWGNEVTEKQTAA